MPVFDIIIPSYNNKTELIACLKGFSQQSFKDFKLFVCLDGSTDNSKSEVEHCNLDLEVIILEHPDKCNHGRNATRNLAFLHLSGEFVLFFDSDITPYPDLLEKHYKILKEKTCISVGNVDYLNKERDLWAGYISKRGYNKFNPLQAMPPELMNMGNLAMPSHFFIQLGGMDANLKKYGGDDSELSIRLEKAFKPLVLNNSLAKGYSILNKTLDFAFAQIEEFGAVNLKYIHQKHPGFGHVYAFDVMNGSNLKSKVFKFLMNRLLASFLQQNINLFPSYFKFKAIHYLTAFSLYKGFTKQL